MEIGPISALRPVSMIKRPLEDPDLSRVVEVEHGGQSEDDEYTPANRKASRGLEDGEEEGQAPTDLDDPKDTDAPARTVSFFA
jgi:hypothetical protein